VRQRAAPTPRLKAAVGTASLLARARRTTPPRRACPSPDRLACAAAAPTGHVRSPLSEHAMPYCPSTSEPSSLLDRHRRREHDHGERRPSCPLAVFHPWNVELTLPSPLAIAGPPPATVASPRRRDAAAELDFFSSLSTRSSVPHVRRVVSPSWVLDRHRLRRLCRCGVVAGRGPSRRRGRGPSATVHLGRAWFRPRGTQIDFFYFVIYSILCKFKNLCRIHLNSENYETNFVGKV
jgi:hypothetical protein